MKHLELTRNRFFHDPMDKSRMGVVTHQLPTFTLKISKSAVDISQLAVILIKTLLGQSSNSLISRSLFEGLEQQHKERSQMLPLWLLSWPSFLTQGTGLVQYERPQLTNGLMMEGPYLGSDSSLGRVKEFATTYQRKDLPQEDRYLGRVATVRTIGNSDCYCVA